jgi:RND family efflux transporter MFP subunit
MSDAEDRRVEAEPHAREERDTPVRPGVLFYLVLLALTAAAGAGLFALLSARQERLQAQERAVAREISAGLPVRVIKPKMTSESFQMRLAGDVRAYFESPIYAKVSGYLRKLHVDKGDRVEAGQLLCVLENPEAEQDYRTAKANYDIAKITNDRNQDLVRDHTVSQQVADQSKAQFLMAQSNLERTRIMVGYEQLRAPFAGVVVARNYDPGFLVPAATASSATTATPVLVLARVDRLRVYVYAPQSDAAFVRLGDPALITFDEFPGRVFEGRVSRFAQALDTATRTMLTEIELPNADRTLLPGMYAQVRLQRQQPKSYPLIPDEALVLRNEKAFVPVVTAERTIHLQPVTLGIDNGIEVQVRAGLTGDEAVALGVGQTVSEGLKVQPVAAKESGAAPAGPKPVGSAGKPEAAPPAARSGPSGPAGAAAPPTSPTPGATR